MLPGVAFLELGFIRSKNAVSIMMQVFTILSLSSIIFILVGFTLAFGTDIGGIIGGLNFLGLSGVGAEAWDGTTISELLFFIFQLMFAAVTVALITGSIAERMKYRAFFLFTIAFIIIYTFPAHWLWGGGWLSSLGVVDFAGGIVVHTTAGVASLVAALVLGRRLGFGSSGLEGHNLPLAMLGGFLLWFGWFGFNGGSALAINEIAINAVVTTNTAAAAGALAAIVLTWIHLGKPSIVMGINGCLAGLAAVTAGAGYVGPMAAFAIGIIAGIICYYSIALLKHRLNIDDALDVTSIHGLPGVWGSVAVGLFADGRLDGVAGLFWGGGVKQLGIQALGAIVVCVFIFAVTTAILKVIQATVGLRVSSREEITGLDLADHRESAYS
jgi:Amt family ammonium transporter